MTRPHGSGSLTHLGGDRWRSRIRLANGKRSDQTIRANGRKAAEAAHHQRLARAGQGELANERRTVADLLDAWLPTAGGAAGTRENRERSARLYLKPKLGHIRLDKLSGWDIANAYQDMPPHAARQAHATISSALKKAVKWGWLRSNPAVGNGPDRPTTRDLAPPAPDAIQQFIDAARDLDMAMLIDLVSVTGMRRGEACALQWKHVDFDKRQITVAQSVTEEGEIKPPKTQSSVRTFAIDAGTMARLRTFQAKQRERARAIDAILTDSSYVFSLRVDARTPYPPMSATRRFAGIRERLGPEYALVRFHDLRHFVATEMIGAGVNPRTVATRLGHKDPTMTLRIYAHALRAQDQDAAEVMGRIVRPTG